MPTPTPLRSVNHVPTVGKTMDFPDALRVVIAGGKVTRAGWDVPNVTVSHEHGYLLINYPDKDPQSLIVTSGDLTASDWVSVGQN